MCELEIINRGKLNRHLILLWPYLKQVVLWIQKGICSQDATRLALYSSCEAKTEAALVVDTKGLNSGKICLTFLAFLQMGKFI